MNKFQCMRLSIVAEAEEMTRLPGYPGGTLRGAFGYALRECVCLVKQKNCRNCVIRNECVYSYIFETPPPGDAEILRKYPFVPHPFVLEVPLRPKEIYKPGEEMKFGMALIGDRAVAYLPHVVAALAEMGRKGIGKGRGRFGVKQIFSRTAQGNPVETINMLSFEDAESLAGTCPPDRLTLEFLTPVRIRYKRALCDDLQFHVLIRNLLRRISGLLYFHCDQHLELPVREMIRRAESVRVVRNQTRWHDWSRYSGRQKRRVKMGGVVGSMTYEGDIREFLPLLVLGSWVNLGKGTSLGLGRYELGIRNWELEHPPAPPSRGDFRRIPKRIGKSGAPPPKNIVQLSDFRYSFLYKIMKNPEQKGLKAK